MSLPILLLFFFFKDTATTEIYTLSLHDALPISACHGERESGGTTVGIIPQDDPSHANEFCDIVIPSGMGLTRDFLNALSADGVIVVGGGSGTLSEICAAYMYKKPIVTLKNSGGIASKYADEYLDHRKNVKIVGVETPQQAIKYILEQINT